MVTEDTIMKKAFVLILATFAIIAACDTQTALDEIIDDGSITFNFSLNHPDAATKAVKTGWENGDAIFIFFFCVHLRVINIDALAEIVFCPECRDACFVCIS